MPGNPADAGTGGRTVPLSLLEKIRGENPADRALSFLAQLRIPEGRTAGKPLKLAGFQVRFVRGALAEGVMVACLSIGRGNAKTALSAGLSLAELVGALDPQPQPKREIIFAARNRDHPILRQHFASVVAVRTDSGLVKMHKGQKRDRIDGAIASAMAVYRLSLGQSNASAYNAPASSGLFVF